MSGDRRANPALGAGGLATCCSPTDDGEDDFERSVVAPRPAVFSAVSGPRSWQLHGRPVLTGAGSEAAGDGVGAALADIRGLPRHTSAPF